MSLRIKHELWIEQGTDEKLCKSEDWLSDLKVQPLLNIPAYVRCCHVGRWALGLIFQFFKRNQKSQFCVTSLNFKMMATNSNIFNSMQAKWGISMSQVWLMKHFFNVLKKSYWNRVILLESNYPRCQKIWHVDLFVIQWPDSPSFLSILWISIQYRPLMRLSWWFP